MNTILISGTAITKGSNLVQYAVNIWASQSNNPIRLINYIDTKFTGYVDLWEYAKNKAEIYFQDSQFQDGAYTFYLDHLIILPN